MPFAWVRTTYYDVRTSVCYSGYLQWSAWGTRQLYWSEREQSGHMLLFWMRCLGYLASCVTMVTSLLIMAGSSVGRGFEGRAAVQQRGRGRELGKLPVCVFWGWMWSLLAKWPTCVRCSLVLRVFRGNRVVKMNVLVSSVLIWLTSSVSFSLIISPSLVISGLHTRQGFFFFFLRWLFFWR